MIFGLFKVFQFTILQFGVILSEDESVCFETSVVLPSSPRKVQMYVKKYFLLKLFGIIQIESVCFSYFVEVIFQD